MQTRDRDLEAAPERAPTASAGEQFVVYPTRRVEIDPTFLLKILRRQIRLITLVVAVGLSFTLIGLLLATPRYTATANILIETRQQKLLDADVIPAGLNSDVVFEGELEILRSSRIASRVLKNLQVQDAVRARDKRFRTSWGWLGLWSLIRPKIEVVQAANPTLGPEPAEKAHDATTATAAREFSLGSIEKLLRGLSVERKGRSYIVEVSFTDRSIARATTIANAFVDAYVADQLEVKSTAARGANLRLKERVLEMSKELVEIERSQQKYRTNPGYAGAENLNSMQKEISGYTLQLVSARASATEAEAQLGKLRGLARDPQLILSINLPLQSTVIRDYRRRAVEIRRRIDEKASHHDTQHAAVISAKAELDNLYLEIKRDSGRTVEDARLAYEEAAGKVKRLEDGLQRLQNSVMKLGEHEITLAGFKRRIAVSNNLYSDLLRRYNEARAQEKQQYADARIVSYAVSPSRPSYPKKGLVLLLASVGWLGAGMALGLVRELTRRTLCSRADVERELGVPCVATVPIVGSIHYGVDEKMQHSLCGPIHWRVDQDPGSGFSQSIFTLKQWTETIGVSGSRVIVVAAAHPAEGCSTIAIQLARYAASTATRSVLVDADLRSHGITQTLGIEANTTYADTVLNGADPKSAVVDLKKHGIHLCPAPPQGDWRPLELLGSRHMQGLFDALRNEFDLIVVDTSPMATYVDASALVDFADGVLVVVKADQTPKKDVLDILQRIDVDSRLAIGIVLNMVDQMAKR